MNLTMHRYRGDEDYWRIREFLRRVFQLNGGRELSWQAYRFDYWRWHGSENLGHGRIEEDVFIWETKDGDIAAVLNPEGPGHVFLQGHPGFRTPELENEMLAVAEKHLTLTTAAGKERLCVWAHEDDTLRKDLLTSRRYTRGKSPEYQRRRPLTLPIPDVPVVAGYTVRSLGDVDEFSARSYVSWKAFHPNEPNDRHGGWEWYHNIQRAPLYRRDLDIVAVAPDGKFASFCTIWLDDVTRAAAFEPVGTAPAHQRKGLGKAVMSEGLRRLKRLGARVAHVGSYTPRAHALYASLGFTEYDVCEPWVKEIREVKKRRV